MTSEKGIIEAMKTIWKYKYRFLVFCFLLAVILAVAIISLSYGKTLPAVNYGHSQLFLEAKTPHYIDYYQMFKENIDRLADCESSGNPEAINWNDNGSPSFGLLQYKQRTFESICVKRYSYRNDLMNEDIQRLCAGEMIKNGLQNHWSCYNKL